MVGGILLVHFVGWCIMVRAQSNEGLRGVVSQGGIEIVFEV